MSATTITRKRSAKQAKAKKTMPAKLSPAIDQLWYAEERLIDDGRFFRDYHKLGMQDRYELADVFQIPEHLSREDSYVSVQAGATTECPPPTHALLAIEIRVFVFDEKVCPSVSAHIYTYGTSAEEVSRRTITNDGYQVSDYGCSIYVPVEVDRRGRPVQAEIDKLRDRVIEEAEAQIKRAVKKAKARSRRASASAKKAAETRRKNRQAAKGGEA